MTPEPSKEDLTPENQSDEDLKKLKECLSMLKDIDKKYTAQRQSWEREKEALEERVKNGENRANNAMQHLCQIGSDASLGLVNLAQKASDRIYLQNRELASLRSELNGYKADRMASVKLIKNLQSEKFALEKELADHKKNHNTAKWSEVLSKRMDQITALEAEIEWYKRWFESLNGHVTVNKTLENWKGLEERVKIIEQDRDSWRRCAERLETEKTEPKLTINIEESAIKELFKNQAQELTRLKSRNEELEAEKSKLEERVKFLERGLSGAEYLWQEKVDRLTSALAMAHEALRYYARCVPCGGTGKTWEHDASCGDNENGDCIADHPKNKVCRGCKGKGNHCLEILSDPTGQLAFEKWKKMVKALQFAKEKRNFEGTPKMIMNDALAVLNDIAKVAKEALQ